MAIVTLNPTSNTTPDPGQGGLAVTGPINTGHASTSVNSTGINDDDLKSCLWTTFQSLASGIISLTLKVDWVANGSLSGVGAGNGWTLGYSINGGSNWNILDAIGDVTSPASATASVTLSPTQNISQVRVRDLLSTFTTEGGETASIQVTVSAIRLEAVISEANRIIVMGM